jgi:hypothetical protein
MDHLHCSGYNFTHFASGIPTHYIAVSLITHILPPPLQKQNAERRSFELPLSLRCGFNVPQILACRPAVNGKKPKEQSRLQSSVNGCSLGH